MCLLPSSNSDISLWILFSGNFFLKEDKFGQFEAPGLGTTSLRGLAT
jgi:hypothetical protein